MLSADERAALKARAPDFGFLRHGAVVIASAALLLLLLLLLLRHLLYTAEVASEAAGNDGLTSSPPS